MTIQAEGCPVKECAYHKRRSKYYLIQHHLAAIGEIKALIVECPRPECNFQCKWVEMTTHYNEHCKFAVVACKSSKNGCRIDVQLQHLNEHLIQCKHRLMVCGYCSQSMIGTEQHVTMHKKNGDCTVSTEMFLRLLY